MPAVFVTGGTGLMGRNLIAELVRRGHVVKALVRRGSERKLPQGCQAIVGDALDKNSYASYVATILRPWYVLGPGRRWPVILKALYWVMGLIPSTRESAERLGLVTLEQMVATLVRSVENPPQGVRILSVPEIRRSIAG